MTEKNYLDKNKKYNEYDRLLKELKDDHRLKASKYIPKLCYALRDEDQNLTKHDISERIRKDLVDIWSRSTVSAYMPDEFKEEQQKEAGKLSHKSIIERFDPGSGSNDTIINRSKK